MSKKKNELLNLPYVYAVAFHENEEELCRMEMRSLFGVEPDQGYVRSDINIDPSRSPFIRGKLTVSLEGADVDYIAEQAEDAVRLEGQTFKVVFIETDDRITYDQQREIERQVGWRIQGRQRCESLSGCSALLICRAAGYLGPMRKAKRCG